MCGIFAYTGQPIHVAEVVGSALQRMEYRGYDSWGCTWEGPDKLKSVKGRGRVPALIPTKSVSTMAIGHTRWATHGKVTARNAHPHLDCTRQIGVVHNGIIENDEQLRGQLARHSFSSETDSEIIAHLVEDLRQDEMDLNRAVSVVFGMLEGSNAIVVCDRKSGSIAAVTSRSPLVVGHSSRGWCLASDVLALAGVCDRVATVPDHTLLSMTATKVSLTVLNTGAPAQLIWQPAPSHSVVELTGFACFMEKEIHDQPAMVAKLMVNMTEISSLAARLNRFDHILLTGCGSAFYAAGFGQQWLGQATDAWVETIPASELEASHKNLGPKTLVMALSQSGETADVVDALHIATSWRAATAAVVNQTESSVARMADVVIPLMAGTERSVLATKSFTAMVVRMLQLSEVSQAADQIAKALPVVESALSGQAVTRVAKLISDRKSAITLGKGVAHQVAKEAALKIKEGGYIDVNAYLNGELKHGPLALVSDRLPSILFATSEGDSVSSKTAAKEIMSRGGYTVGIGPFVPGDCDIVLAVPEIGPATVLPQIVLAQRIGYEVARHQGVNPDYPRNLAKSVTVR